MVLPQLYSIKNFYN